MNYVCKDALKTNNGTNYNDDDDEDDYDDDDDDSEDDDDVDDGSQVVIPITIMTTSFLVCFTGAQ